MRVSALQYAKTLYELSEKKSHAEINEIVGEFAKLLEKKRQVRLLPKIIEKFNEIYNKENGIIEAEVITRSELDKKNEKELEKFILKKYNGNKVEIIRNINPSIKGGIIIRVGDEVMDGSISHQLQSLKKELAC